MKRLACANHNNPDKRVYVMFPAGEKSPRERNLSKTKENVSLVKDENLYNGEKEQKDVEQAVNHTNITGEVVIPPGGKTSVVIICTAV